MPESKGAMQRRKTRIVQLDSDDTDRNVLPLSTLISFLENFVLKRCRKRLTRTQEEEQTPPPLGLEVFGLACGLNFKCECGAKMVTVVAESTEKCGR
jgi:hypothetical protein